MQPGETICMWPVRAAGASLAVVGLIRSLSRVSKEGQLGKIDQQVTRPTGKAAGQRALQNRDSEQIDLPGDPQHHNLARRRGNRRLGARAQRSSLDPSTLDVMDAGRSQPTTSP
jgi:hypothetical protein